MKHALLISLLLLTLTACSGRGGTFSGRNATGYVANEAEQCVPFARRTSGINLYGDAASWWWQANGRYARGSDPIPGAVLVLKQTKKLRSGHVAVVKDVVNDHQITVSHSNWGSDRSTRRNVYTAQLAEDISPRGDWSSVRFWNKDANSFGFPYPAYGFIYPTGESAIAAETMPKKRQSIWSFVDSLF